MMVMAWRRPPDRGAGDSSLRGDLGGDSHVGGGGDLLGRRIVTTQKGITTMRGRGRLPLFLFAEAAAVPGFRLAVGSATAPANTVGRLEVSRDTSIATPVWRTVCDDYFDSTVKAQVTCKSVGAPTTFAYAYIHPGGVAAPSVTPETPAVSCTGAEANILQCFSTSNSVCDHTEDVGVICRATAPARWEYRLTGLGLQSSGRVELRPSPDDLWGTIDGALVNTAAQMKAICVSLGLGYTTAVVPVKLANFAGPASSPIYVVKTGACAAITDTATQNDFMTICTGIKATAFLSAETAVHAADLSIQCKAPCPGPASDYCNMLYANGLTAASNFPDCVCNCFVGYDPTQKCEQCAVKYSGFPTCVPSPCSNAVACNGNALSMSGNLVSGCVCAACVVGYAGATCNQCAVKYTGYGTPGGCVPQSCVLLTACGANAATVTGDAVNGCVCQCKVGFAGATCTQCAVGFMPLPWCDQCNLPLYEGYPDCQEVRCKNATDCSSRAETVSGTLVQGCTCTCLRGFIGAQCDACEVNYVGFPDCVPQPCDATVYCSNHAASVDGNLIDGCVCHCLEGFDPAARCAACLKGYKNYPVCEIDVCTVQVQCYGFASNVTRTDDAECVCDCIHPRVGQHCDSCAPGYETDSVYVPCQAIACDVVTNCANHAAYVNGTLPIGCQCHCMEGFNHSHDCQSCARGYENYPACTAIACTVERDCGNRAFNVTGTIPIGCQCDCVWGHNATAACETCLEPWFRMNVSVISAPGLGICEPQPCLVEQDCTGTLQANGVSGSYIGASPDASQVPRVELLDSDGQSHLGIGYFNYSVLLPPDGRYPFGCSCDCRRGFTNDTMFLPYWWPPPLNGSLPAVPTTPPPFPSALNTTGEPEGDHNATSGGPILPSSSSRITAWRGCSACASNYGGFPDCTPLPCSLRAHCNGPSVAKSVNGDLINGCQCVCQDSTQGSQCERCHPLFAGWPNCVPKGCGNTTVAKLAASCHPLGTDRMTGSLAVGCSCRCHASYVGRRCDACAPGFTKRRLQASDLDYDSVVDALSAVGTTTTIPGDGFMFRCTLPTVTMSISRPSPSRSRSGGSATPSVSRRSSKSGLSMSLSHSPSRSAASRSRTISLMPTVTFELFPRQLSQKQVRGEAPAPLDSVALGVGHAGEGRIRFVLRVLGGSFLTCPTSLSRRVWDNASSIFAAATSPSVLRPSSSGSAQEVGGSSSALLPTAAWLHRLVWGMFTFQSTLSSVQQYQSAFASRHRSLFSTTPLPLFASIGGLNPDNVVLTDSGDAQSEALDQLNSLHSFVRSLLFDPSPLAAANAAVQASAAAPSTTTKVSSPATGVPTGSAATPPPITHHDAMGAVSSAIVAINETVIVFDMNMDAQYFAPIDEVVTVRVARHLLVNPNPSNFDASQTVNIKWERGFSSVPEGVVTAAKAGVVGASVASSVLTATGASASQAAKSLALFDLLLCDSDLGSPLDPNQSPTGVAVTNDLTRYHVGAMLFNPLLILSVAAAHAVFAALVARMRSWSVTHTMAMLRFPSLEVIPYMFFAQDTVTSSLIVAVKHESVTWRIFGGFSLLFLWVGSILATIVFLRKYFRAAQHRMGTVIELGSSSKDRWSSQRQVATNKARLEQLEAEHKALPLHRKFFKGLRWFFLGDREWISLAEARALSSGNNDATKKPTEPSGSSQHRRAAGRDDGRRGGKKDDKEEFIPRFAPLFTAYRIERYWFFVAEELTVLALGAAVAFQPQDGECGTVAAVFTTILGLYALCVIVLRPYLAPFDQGFSVALAVMQFMAAILAVVATLVAGHESWGNAALFLTTAVTGMSMFKTLLDVMLIGYEIYEDSAGCCRDRSRTTTLQRDDNNIRSRRSSSNADAATSPEEDNNDATDGSDDGPFRGTTTSPRRKGDDAAVQQQLLDHADRRGVTLNIALLDGFPPSSSQRNSSRTMAVTSNGGHSGLTSGEPKHNNETLPTPTGNGRVAARRRQQRRSLLSSDDDDDDVDVDVGGAGGGGQQKQRGHILKDHYGSSSELSSDEGDQRHRGGGLVTMQQRPPPKAAAPPLHMPELYRRATSEFDDRQRLKRESRKAAGASAREPRGPESLSRRGRNPLEAADRRLIGGGLLHVPIMSHDDCDDDNELRTLMASATRHRQQEAVATERARKRIGRQGSKLSESRRSANGISDHKMSDHNGCGPPPSDDDDDDEVPLLRINLHGAPCPPAHGAAPFTAAAATTLPAAGKPHFCDRRREGADEASLLQRHTSSYY